MKGLDNSKSEGSDPRVIAGGSFEGGSYGDFGETVKRKIEDFRKGFQKIFPGLKIDYFLYADIFDEPQKIRTISWYINSFNSSFANSQYCYNGNQLIHFTNLKALYSILQEKSIRLYNLHNSNDPSEFSFASNLLSLENRKITGAKNSLFTVSFCAKNLMQNRDAKFNLWRLYGDDGRGVAIVFTIENTPTQWVNFHFSNVHYGTDLQSKYLELQKLIRELSVSEPRVEVNLDKFIPFHKSNLYRVEEEVRLIFDDRTEKGGDGQTTFYEDNLKVFPNINTDLFKILENKTKVRYVSLPIFPMNYKEPVGIALPSLKIDAILLGYNFDQKLQKRIILKLKDLCDRQLQYTPTISPSLLNMDYWGL